MELFGRKAGESRLLTCLLLAFLQEAFGWPRIKLNGLLRSKEPVSDSNLRPSLPAETSAKLRKSQELTLSRLTPSTIRNGKTVMRFL